jgi:type IV pilus biogenesis protein PilP
MPHRKLMPGWLALVLCTVGGNAPVYAVPNELPPSPPAQVAEKTALLPVDERDFTLRRLEKIQTETVIVEAQVARAKALKSLEDNGSSANLPEVSDGMAAVAVHVSAPRNARGLPRISEIYGAGSRLIARLALNEGSQAEFTVGQHIPGTQLRVTRISAREVQVSALDGSSVQALNFTRSP